MDSTISFSRCEDLVPGPGGIPDAAFGLSIYRIQPDNDLYNGLLAGGGTGFLATQASPDVEMVVRVAARRRLGQECERTCRFGGVLSGAQLQRMRAMAEDDRWVFLASIV